MPKFVVHLRVANNRQRVLAQRLALDFDCGDFMKQQILDDLDLKILEEMRHDVRRSNVEIATQLGVSEATVRRRIDKILESGAAKLVLAVDHKKIGYPVEALIFIKAEVIQLDSVARQIAACEEVVYLAMVAGDFDLVANALFRADSEIFEFVREKIAPIPGIKDLQTVYVMKMMKRVTSRIPI